MIFSSLDLGITSPPPPPLFFWSHTGTTKSKQTAETTAKSVRDATPVSQAETNTTPFL